MSRYTTSYDDKSVDELIEEFIVKCNYTRKSNLLYMLRKPASQAAEICKELNVDAATYVDAHTRFAPIIRGYTSLTPQQLHCRESKNYVIDFLALSSNTVSNKRSLFETQCILFARCLENGWEQTLCLSNPSFDFAPWFRILLAPDRNEELITKYGASAAHILNHEPLLYDYLKTIKSDDGNTLDFSRIPQLNE